MTEALYILKTVYAGNRQFINDSIRDASDIFLEKHPNPTDSDSEELYTLLFNPFKEASSSFEVYLESTRDDSDLVPFVIQVWIDTLSESKWNTYRDIVEILRSDESQYPIPPSQDEVHP